MEPLGDLVERHTVLDLEGLEAHHRIDLDLVDLVELRIGLDLVDLVVH